MLKKIYDARKNLTTDMIKSHALELNPSINIDIINDRSMITNESNIEYINDSIRDLIKNSSIDSSNVYNKMSLQNDQCVINI